MYRSTQGLPTAEDALEYLAQTQGRGLSRNQAHSAIQEWLTFSTAVGRNSPFAILLPLGEAWSHIRPRIAPRFIATPPEHARDHRVDSEIRQAYIFQRRIREAAAKTVPGQHTSHSIKAESTGNSQYHSPQVYQAHHSFDSSDANTNSNSSSNGTSIGTTNLNDCSGNNGGAHLTTALTMFSQGTNHANYLQNPAGTRHSPSMIAAVKSGEEPMSNMTSASAPNGLISPPALSGLITFIQPPSESDMPPSDTPNPTNFRPSELRTHFAPLLNGKGANCIINSVCGEYLSNSKAEGARRQINGLEDENNCTLFIWNVPSCNMALLFDAINTGAVFSLSLLPPTGRRTTYAGKLDFVTPEGASRFIAQSRSSGVWVQGCRISARYNRFGNIQAWGIRTRVLIIEGPAKIMYEKYWLDYFSKACVFQIDRALSLDSQDSSNSGRRKMEFRFFRIDGQAETCYKEIKSQTAWKGGIVTVMYGRDPCEGRQVYRY